MRVLVLNSGSSSIRYELFDVVAWRVLCSGRVEGIGTPGGRHVHLTHAEDGRAGETVLAFAAADHGQALKEVIRALHASGFIEDVRKLAAIGHRVVHGGERFRAAALVDEEVLSAIRGSAHLAPLHNPANLLGIELAIEACPGVPQVAVFDTAFHQTMPPHAYRYALPRELYARHGVRRYGFHGTSHAYVSRRAAALLGRPLESLNLVTLHLGNGASAAAIRGGSSVDTSMGLTPLEGLVMGTRSGDVDPAVVFHLGRVARMSLDASERLLNEESGLLGLCGASDMREVLRRADLGDGEARLAVDVTCYRIRKYLGAYLAVLGRIDAVVFTAGVGENSPDIRAQCCQGLSGLGIAVDEERNRAPSRDARPIHADGAPVAVLVVPTDEEMEIAHQAMQCIRDRDPRRSR